MAEEHSVKIRLEAAVDEASFNEAGKTVTESVTDIGEAADKAAQTTQELSKNVNELAKAAKGTRTAADAILVWRNAIQATDIAFDDLREAISTGADDFTQKMEAAEQATRTLVATYEELNDDLGDDAGKFFRHEPVEAATKELKSLRGKAGDADLLGGGGDDGDDGGSSPAILAAGKTAGPVAVGVAIGQIVEGGLQEAKRNIMGVARAFKALGDDSHATGMEMERVFRQNSGVVESFASRWSSSFQGMTTDLHMFSMAVNATMLGTNLNADEKVDFIDRAHNLAQSLAEVPGVNDDDALAAVQSAFAGDYSDVQAMGMTINSAAVSTRMLENGFFDVTDAEGRARAEAQLLAEEIAKMQADGTSFTSELGAWNSLMGDLKDKALQAADAVALVVRMWQNQVGEAASWFGFGGDDEDTPPTNPHGDTPETAASREMEDQRQVAEANAHTMMMLSSSYLNAAQKVQHYKAALEDVEGSSERAVEIGQALNAARAQSVNLIAQALKQQADIQRQEGRSRYDINLGAARSTQDANRGLARSMEDLDIQFERSLEDRGRALGGFFNLTQRIFTEYAPSARTAITNVESQVRAFRIWKEGIEELKARGVSTEMLDMFGLNDPQAWAAVRALAGSGEDALAEFIEKAQEGVDLAAEAGEEPTTQMLIDQERAIADLLRNYERTIKDIALNTGRAMTDLATTVARQMEDVEYAITFSLGAAGEDGPEAFLDAAEAAFSGSPEMLAFIRSVRETFENVGEEAGKGMEAGLYGYLTGQGYFFDPLPQVNPDAIEPGAGPGADVPAPAPQPTDSTEARYGTSLNAGTIAQSAIYSVGAGTISSAYRSEKDQEAAYADTWADNGDGTFDPSIYNSHHLDQHNPAHDIAVEDVDDGWALFDFIWDNYKPKVRQVIFGNAQFGPDDDLPRSWTRNDHWDHVHVAHQGGEVSAAWPTLQGLRQDERPVITQIGERIISKREVGQQSAISGELVGVLRSLAASMQVGGGIRTEQNHYGPITVEARASAEEMEHALERRKRQTRLAGGA